MWNMDIKDFSFDPFLTIVEVIEYLFSFVVFVNKFSLS